MERERKTYAEPDAEFVDAREVVAEPPEVEAPLVAEEPADEVVASVEAALEPVDVAPVDAVLLEPEEPDAADEEPELVRQLSAVDSTVSVDHRWQIRGTYSQTAQ